MSSLFEKTEINNMEIRNRFVRSATCDCHADIQGHVTEAQIKLINDLAAGGVGLIVSGICYVCKNGQILTNQNSIASDDCINGFKKLTKTAHDHGAKFAMQLFHGGRDRAELLKGKSEQAIGPSFVPDDPYFPEEYRSMTQDEIWDIIGAFGDGARRAREAGFDAVQIHGAHAMLPSQFLSPYANRRSDEWGGSLENRLRFHREIYKDIRKKVGEDYPVLIKIGVQDEFPGGLEFSEGKQAAKLLSQCGYDALEISQGLRGEWYEGTEFRPKIDCLEREGYFRNWCKEIKDEVNVPTIMVGGLRSFELMEEVIQKAEADFVSLSRPLIREPGIINEWKIGNRHKATCISCNLCLDALRDGEGLQCRQLKSQKGK